MYVCTVLHLNSCVNTNHTSCINLTVGGWDITPTTRWPCGQPQSLLSSIIISEVQKGISMVSPTCRPSLFLHVPWMEDVHVHVYTSTVLSNTHAYFQLSIYTSSLDLQLVTCIREPL